MSPPRRAGVASPCTSVCRMADTGWCEGCWRSLDEIAAWASLDDLERRRICKQLPLRRAGAGTEAGGPGSAGGPGRPVGAPGSGEHE